MAQSWGYSVSNGPNTWAQCFPDAAGARQSPVDIKPVSSKVMKTQQKLSWKYAPQSGETVSNPGYGWKVQCNGKGTELVGGPLEGKYMLEQFHCHWGSCNEEGSEHTIEGKKYSGELHLVHWNTKYPSFGEAAKHPDGLSVLGVFLKPGRKNEELDKVVQQLKNVEFKNQTAKIPGSIDPSLFLPNENSYFTYQGSLTTPPCSECVIWIVFKEPIEVSEAQLEAFRSLKSYCCQEQCPCDDFQGYVKTNSRPTVPIGQREICECIH